MSTPAATSQASSAASTLAIRLHGHFSLLAACRGNHPQKGQNWAFMRMNQPNLQPKQPNFRKVLGCGNLVQLDINPVESTFTRVQNWLRFGNFLFQRPTAATKLAVDVRVARPIVVCGRRGEVSRNSGSILAHQLRTAGLLLGAALLLMRIQ